MSRRLMVLLAAIFTCLGLAGTGSAATAVIGSSDNVLADTSFQPPPDYTGIDCEVGIDYPHKSTHVPGQINVTADVDCSDPVTLIELTVELYDNGVLVASKYFAKGPGSYLPGQANTDCDTGNYTGAAAVTVYFPTGYPRVISDTFYSPTIHITC